MCEGPLGIATGYGSVWVVCYWRRHLVRIDADTRRILARIRVRRPAQRRNRRGRCLGNEPRSHSVTRVDPRTNTVAATIRFDGDVSPYGVAVAGVAFGLRRAVPRTVDGVRLSDHGRYVVRVRMASARVSNPFRGSKSFP